MNGSKQRNRLAPSIDFSPTPLTILELPPSIGESCLNALILVIILILVLMVILFPFLILLSFLDPNPDLDSDPDLNHDPHHAPLPI